MLKKEKSLVDVVLFGSAMKSKEKPNDLDVCVLLREKNYPESERLVYEVVKLGRAYSIKVHCEPLAVDDLWTEKLFFTLLSEGYSVSQDEIISSSLGYDSGVLFTYSLESKNASDKVRFSYALYGRSKEEGLLYELGGKSIGRGAFIVSTSKSETVKAFFKQWDVKFESLLIINKKV